MHITRQQYHATDALVTDEIEELIALVSISTPALVEFIATTGRPTASGDQQFESRITLA